MKENSNNCSTSNTILLLVSFLILIILAYIYFNHSRIKSDMKNVTPYIAQDVFLNIYTTPEDYPKYQWLFKANLLHNIRISKGNDYVFIPRTVANIPIFVYNNAPKTGFTITANGIEQGINSCDFIATTF
jgi:hypothetical protein